MRRLILLCVFALIVMFSYGQDIPKNTTLKSLDNHDVSVNALLKNQLVVVSFWATWCKPCQSELKALAELEKIWKDKIKIIAISVDDSKAKSKVKSLVIGRKWPFEVLLDQNKMLYQALNITSIPYSMIIYNGKTEWTHTGYIPGNESIIIDKALKILQQKSVK